MCWESRESGNINGDGSMVLKVYYTRDTYTVTFDGNGGTLASGSDSQTVKYGGMVVAPTYTKKGYSLDSWDKSLKNISENQMIIAQWKINQYTLAINFNNGDENIMFTQDYGSEIPTLEEPTRSGYELTGGWEDLPETMPAEDKTINLVWSAIFEHSNGTITGWTAYGRSTVDYRKAIIKIPAEIDGETITAVSGDIFDQDQHKFSSDYPLWKSLFIPETLITFNASGDI